MAPAARSRSATSPRGRPTAASGSPGRKTTQGDAGATTEAMRELQREIQELQRQLQDVQRAATNPQATVATNQFALAPALVNPTDTIDYATKEGRNLFAAATKELTTKFDSENPKLTCEKVRIFESLEK